MDVISAANSEVAVRHRAKAKFIIRIEVCTAGVTVASK
jgi:hypothetical protein